MSATLPISHFKRREKWSECEKNRVVLYSGVAASRFPANCFLNPQKVSHKRHVNSYTAMILSHKTLAQTFPPKATGSPEATVQQWSCSTVCTLFWQSLTELKHITSPAMPSLQEWMYIHAAVSSASPAAVETWMTQKQFGAYFTKLAPSLRTNQSNAIYVEG